MVVDPRTGVVTPQGYASNALTSVTVVTPTVATQVAYSFTLAAAPIKAQSLRVYLKVIATGVVTAQGLDIGVAEGGAPGIGQIYGTGLSGTVNYATGVVSITLAADPLATRAISVDYQQNYELSADIPAMDSFYDSKAILARVYALKGTMGMLQSFGMTKRFGLIAEEELARDLVQEINREIGGDLVRKLAAVAIGTNSFSRTAPGGVSYFEHKQTYKDELAKAEAQILTNSGRGTISTLIVGKGHAAVLQTLPGFVKISDGNTLGSHVFGTLDGITVVRVTETSVMASDAGLAIWKGSSPFEAAAVYSPFMPLAVTGTLPQANPLQSQRAAAVWAGVEALVPQFVTNFNVTA